jgi:hypothetical protein
MSQLQMFYRPIYLGLVLFTDIQCHRTGTSHTARASIMLLLSPLPRYTIFSLPKLDSNRMLSPTTTNARLFLRGTVIYCAMG